MKLLLKAYAKLNLMLDILSALPNGYHDLFMVMQSVSLCDDVTLETNESGALFVTCSDPAVPQGEENLAGKAARVFFEETGVPFQGLSISIDKHIPCAAGLAGGSADAAAVLVGLNRLFGASLSDRDLIRIGASLGSDVPFCALGGLMLAQHTGTVLSYLPALPFGKIVLVKPDCTVSTAEAYKAFDTAERVRHLDRTGMFQSLMQNDLEGVYRRIDNVFEQFIDVPERVVIKGALRRHCAECACMSGSGPSVFGFFASEDDAEEAARELRRNFRHVFVCDCVDKGCEIVQHPTVSLR